ncbi:hypothetical protein [Estrella lausannensis]|uniref:Putative membrane protein n=1 Tax=Estrella lausannensis TaxID=483423 RepID=A0A0H5DPN3_9BACT|nr:hypothetical protein [Estrella lausannensis]CRX37444.1 putative membrane protein [Estrella lausannensis]
MTQERELTRCESFGLAQGLTKTLDAWDQSQNHPVIGKVGARVIGVMVTPVASVIDAIAHLILFGSKLVVATVLLPYNFIATLFIPSIALPKDLEISSSLVHLTRTAESVIGIVTLPVMCIFDPGRASLIANHKNYTQDNGKPAEKTPPEVKDRKKLVNPKKRKRSDGAKPESSRKAAKAETKEDLKALLAEVEKNSEVLTKKLGTEKVDPVSDFSFGFETKPITAGAATEFFMEHSLDSLAPMQDEQEFFALDMEAYQQKSLNLDSMLDELDALAEEIEAYKKSQFSFSLDSILDDELVFEQEETVANTQLAESMEETPEPPKPKSDFKFEPNPGPLPKPKKLNVQEGDFSLLAANLKQKSNLADKLKAAKSKPGLSELVPHAVKQVKPMIESNKSEVAGALKVTEQQLAKEHEEKVKNLKPVYGSVMEELMAKSEEFLAKSKKAHEQLQQSQVVVKPAEVVFSDLSVKARMKLMQEMGSDIGVINEFLATLTKDDAELLYGSNSGKAEVNDLEVNDLDEVELYSSFDFTMGSLEESTYVTSSPSMANVEVEQIAFNAPALFMEEGDAIVKWVAELNWQTNGLELEQKRQEMLNMLSSVRRYNKEWNLNSSLPSPYALAEQRLYQLARFIELDRDAQLSGYQGTDISAISVFGDADAEGLTGLSVLHVLEEVADCLITINLMDKEVQENPDDWSTGLNARRYIKANEALHRIQTLAFENKLGTRLAGFLMEAEDAVKLITDMTVEEILELPLAPREELEPGSILPFSQGVKGELEMIRQQVKEGLINHSEALMRMKTLYSLWKSQGADLEEGVEDFEEALCKADKAHYLQGSLAGSQAVKEGLKALRVIRSAAFEMKFRTFETLDAEHQERMRVSEKAMDKLKAIVALDDAEADALEAIFQEAYAYSQMGYADQAFVADITIDEVFVDLENETKELSGKVKASDRGVILSLYERIVGYRAQWEFEDRVLSSFKAS